MTGPDPPPARLCRAALEALPCGVARPAAGSGPVPIGVVHLGVGNFFRAHQAVVFDALIAGGDRRWGVCGVSLQRPAMRDALAPQDGLYTLIERDGGPPRASVIGALQQLQVAPESPRAVVARIADPGVALVTLTITEKGYAQAGPASAAGLLAAGFAARRAAGHGARPGHGLTVLSCDNLSNNGRRLRERVMAEARALDPALGDWIDAHGSFPGTMVDRIVPATTDADRDDAQRLLGCADAWPVSTEPFTQWVIEDRFAGPRPDLEAAGVQLVADVSPWEAMKLRLLNAAHSSLAYLGAPTGLATVDAALARPELRAFVERLWRQAAPTLPAAVRGQADDYTRRLLRRFDNPALGHRLRQIAIDGSQKLPQRLVATLRECRRQALPCDAPIWAVAAWIRWLGGRDEDGGLHAVDDPMAARLCRLAGAGPDAAASVAALLAVDEVFGDDLRHDRVVVEGLAAALRALREHGSLGALSRAAGPPGGARVDGPRPPPLSSAA